MESIIKNEKLLLVYAYLIANILIEQNVNLSNPGVIKKFQNWLDVHNKKKDGPKHGSDYRQQLRIARKQMNKYLATV